MLMAAARDMMVTAVFRDRATDQDAYPWLHSRGYTPPETTSTRSRNTSRTTRARTSTTVDHAVGGDEQGRRRRPVPLFRFWAVRGGPDGALLAPQDVRRRPSGGRPLVARNRARAGPSSPV